jgi:hypothetical protein
MTQVGLNMVFYFGQLDSLASQLDHTIFAAEEV